MNILLLAAALAAAPVLPLPPGHVLTCSPSATWVGVASVELLAPNRLEIRYTDSDETDTYTIQAGDACTLSTNLERTR